MRVVINHALTHTYPPTPTHTHPHQPTHTQPKKRTHLHTPTYTHPKTGHTYPHVAKKGHTYTHSPTTSQKLGHTHPHLAKKKITSTNTSLKERIHMSNTIYIHKMNSLFPILAGVFIFKKDWPVKLLTTSEAAFESIVCLSVFNN